MAPEIRRLDVDRVHELVEVNDFTTLSADVRAMDLHDLTELMGELTGDDLGVVFRFLPGEPAADIFGDLDFEQQEALLEHLSSERLATILNDMAPDERTELLEELPGELAQRLMNHLRGDELKVARTLLAYPEDSIGRLMTPEYVAVRADWTIDMVLRHIRKVAPRMETLNVIYVVDEHWKLLDDITLEQVILAEPTDTVQALMDEQVGSLVASADRETAGDEFRKYEAVAMPVVDTRGTLVGIVTVDDVLDVVEEEATEDVQKMAAMAPLEYSYFGTSFWGMLAKRLPWLALLLAAQMLSSSALSRFRDRAVFAVLVIFMPLINATAGNTGAQVAVLMTRGLAVQEMTPGDWLRVLIRELLRGLTMGLILAAVGFAAVCVLMAGSVEHAVTDVAVAVAVSMIVAVTLANLLGAMLPFVFKGIGLDPATTSGPFIAWIMDFTGIVLYFTIATAILTAVS